jgi:hypothetical protein
MKIIEENDGMERPLLRDGRCWVPQSLEGCPDEFLDREAERFLFFPAFVKNQ